MDVVHFYTTAGCHLCEQAMVLLAPIAGKLGLRIDSHDIAADDGLMERYGIRIPVVRRDGATDDLGWPFDERELRNYLERVAAG